jgi:DNA-binding IclR family transcriptional regulator
MDSTTPALERALAILDRLGESPGGLSAAALATAVEVPRASLYRMLRVLAEREYVVVADGGYRLGPAVTRLAGRIATRDLPALAQPLMDALSARTGESVKLVVREGTEAVTVAAAHSGNDARIAVRIGHRLPLYVGASQRLLLSRAPPEVVAAVLASPRRRIASGTITGARELRRSLAELALFQSVAGHSEGIEGVGAAAACVDDATGATRAVLVSVYIQAGKTATRLRELREATEDAARELSRLLGGR